LIDGPHLDVGHLIFTSSSWTKWRTPAFRLLWLWILA